MQSAKALKVGITGGIGAGKSIVSRVFQVLGVPVYDSDSRAKELMYSPRVKEAVVGLFGKEAYLDGRLNRKLLAQAAFKDHEKLRKLNEVVHPAVAEDFLRWADIQIAPYLLQEAALIFEAGSYQRLDRVIMVTAPTTLRVSRVLARDCHRKESDVKDIMDRQWPEEEKIRRSDYIICNDGTTLVIPQVLNIHKAIIASLSEV